MNLHLFQKVAAHLAERAKRKQITASAYHAIETGDEKAFSTAIEAEPGLLTKEKFLLALEQYGNEAIVTAFLKHIEDPNIEIIKSVGSAGRAGAIYAFRPLLVWMIQAGNHEGAAAIASDLRTDIRFRGRNKFRGPTPLQAAENQKGSSEALKKLIGILREREAELHEQRARNLRGQSDQNLKPTP